MSWSTTLATAPTASIVSLSDVKLHLRGIDTADFDARLTRLIASAREWVEAYTHRATLTQTWDLYLDCFPRVIELPYPPLQSVTAASFVYVAGDGTPTQVPTAVYTVDADHLPGRIYEAYGQSWPTPRVVEKAVTVRFVAGYGAATDLPGAMVDAALLYIENQFDHAGTSEDLSMAAKRLLDPYRVQGF